MHKYQCFIMSLFIAVLAGCSTKIHLFTDGYQSKDVIELSQQLRDIGFDVSISSLAVPAHFPNSVIAINPVEHSDTLQLLQLFLTEHQFEQAKILSFGQNRHYYSDGNIGLYLRHPQFDATTTMPAYVRSINCKFRNALMAFNSDRSVLLETENKFEVLTQQGHWSKEGDRVTVTLANNQIMTYTQQKILRSTAFGLKPALHFRADDHNIDNALSCNYEIVMVEVA